jgi:hypothetical protein
MGGVKMAVLEGRVCEICMRPLPASGEPQTCSVDCATELANQPDPDELEAEWYGNIEAELYS